MRHFCQLASCISYKCQSFFALTRADLCVISVMTKLANLPLSKHATMTQCWPTVYDAESTLAQHGFEWVGTLDDAIPVMVFTHARF